MKLYPLSLLLIVFVSSCKEHKSLSAQDIIDKTIKNAGSEKYEASKVSFTFRKNTYTSTRSCEKYTLERVLKDSTGTKIHDKIDNNGLTRNVDGRQMIVADSLVTRISDGVNSVHYFANLPYGLNASAVNKELVGQATIKEKDYYEIKVTFNQEGGGSDFQDVFMYWIDKQKFTIDYLAYSYEVNEGGIRFRQAYNPRVIEGIRFVDYNNYKPKYKTVKLQQLDSLFLQKDLELLSKIETENVQVQLLDPDC